MLLNDVDLIIMMRDIGAAALATTMIALFIVSSRPPRIDSLKIINESAFHIEIKYKYPEGRDRLIAIFNSGGSFGFERYKDGWWPFGEYLQKRSDKYGLEGEVVLVSQYPNSPYVIIKNNRSWISRKPRHRYYEYELNSFRIFSNTNLDLSMFKIFDEHLDLLAKKHGKSINKFVVIYLNVDVPSVIIGDRVILGKPSPIELVHEFAHIFSLYKNVQTIKYLGELNNNAEKFAENRNLNTYVGHPASNISELLASIITLYTVQALPDLNEKEQEAIKYIANFYMLDELKERLHGIIGKGK